MTKTIRQFDRANCRALQDAIVAALGGVEKEFGVKISTAGGTMDGASFRAKFKCVVTDTAALVADDRRKFSMYCAMFNLTTAHFGAVLAVNGEQQKLVGLQPNRSKFPAIMENVTTGERLMFTSLVLDRIRDTVKV